MINAASNNLYWPRDEAIKCFVIRIIPAAKTFSTSAHLNIKLSNGIL